jgi:hypothetical protein
MFQFPRLAFPTYVLSRESPGFARPGCPIRKSTGSLLPANRGLSQVATSFFASRCQGIRRMPLLAWLKNRSYRLSLRKAGCRYHQARSYDVASVTLAFNCQRSQGKFPSQELPKIAAFTAPVRPVSTWWR